MYKKNKILAIIPARGNSKRIRNKNIKLVNLKPLIQYTIEGALKSKYLDEIVVSSENNKILNLSKSLGVKILKRPKFLSEDFTTTYEVVEHVLQYYNFFDLIIILQPTSPLRNERHINQSIRLMLKKKANGIISVCRTEHSPLWCNVLPKNFSMKNFLSKKIMNKRSQELETQYRLNGAIFLYKVNKLLKFKNL